MPLALSDEVHLVELVSAATFVSLAADRGQASLAILRSAVIGPAAGLA